MNTSSSTPVLNLNQKLLKTDKFCQSCSAKFNIFKKKVFPLSKSLKIPHLISNFIDP